MSSPEEGMQYIVEYQEFENVTEADQRQAAVQNTHSHLRQWRSRFVDSEIAPRSYGNKLLGSQSPTEAVAEIEAADSSRLKYELSGEEGSIIVTEYLSDGTSRQVIDDFVDQHTDLARIIYECDDEVATG